MGMNAVIEKSWGLDVISSNIPNELKKFNRFIVWTAKEENDKWQKIPKRFDNPILGASVNDPNHWTDFDTALKTFENNPKLSGIGFVMNNSEGDTGLFSIDLDHCIEDGELNKQAKYIVDHIATYWEFSPSGNGLRAFGFGQLPGPSFNNQEHHIEMYGGDSSRFLTLTGHRLDDTIENVCKVDTDKLEKLYHHYKTSSATEVLDEPMPELIHNVVFDIYKGKLSGEHADFLWDGVVASKYASRSEQLLACIMNLYLCDCSDAEVLTICYENFPYTVALDHRRQDRDKALEFLWQQCLVAKSKLGTVDQDDFENLDDHHQYGLGFIHVPEFEGKQVPVKEWLIKDWLPMGYVTSLYGDGGTGKSLLAMDIQTCVAKGINFFDAETKQGPVVGVYCEDSPEDLHIRQDAINNKYFLDYTELQDSYLCSRVGMDNLLMVFDGRDTGKLTKFWEALYSQLKDIKPVLVIIDTAADTFGGNENIRPQVRQYIQHALGKIAVDLNCAVLLCAHPSVAGMTSGSGTGGSTAWNNTVRSRLYLTKDETLGPLRLLSRMKANYADTDEEIRMAWKDGAFVPEAVAGDILEEPEAEARRLFIEMLKLVTDMDESVSTSKNGKYAPKRFAELARAKKYKGVTLKRMETAMDQLTLSGEIALEEGRKGRSKRLVLAEKSPMEGVEGSP